nr:zinc finger Ran-binding domain-containing protein 2 isoform X6 [Hydra vulgaris]
MSSEESEPTRSRSRGSNKKLKKREEVSSSEESEPTRSRSRGSNKKLKKREEVSSSEESEPTCLRSCGSKKKLKKREEVSSSESEPTRSRSSGSKKTVEKMLLQLMELQKDTLLRVKQLEEDKDTFSSQATNDLSYDGYCIYRRRHRGPTSYSTYRKWVNNNGVDNSSFNWKGRMRGGGRGRGGWHNHKNFNLFKL